MKIRVEKRNGKVEDYDATKIRKVTKAAGLTEEEAKKLCQTVDQWLAQSGKKRVTSLQIRDRVLVEIQKINKLVAQKFIWYEKYKDKHYGIDL